MTLFNRFKIVTYGILEFILGIIMLTYPDYGYRIVLLVIGLYLMFSGYKNLFYFFSMARYMVDGRLILVKAVILLDFGFLAGSLTDVPRIYILIYLMVLHTFEGTVELLRSYEDKRVGSHSWKLKMFHGILDLFIVILCIVFIANNNTVVIIFSTGLIYSSIIRIITGFRKSSFLYVQ